MRDDAPVEAIRYLLSEWKPPHRNVDWFWAENELSELYRESLTPQEQARWSATWFDIAMSKEEHSDLCFAALLKTKHEPVYQMLVSAYDKGKLDESRSARLASTLLDYGYPEGIRLAREIARADPEWFNDYLVKAAKLEKMLEEGKLEYDLS